MDQGGVEWPSRRCGVVIEYGLQQSCSTFTHVLPFTTVIHRFRFALEGLE